MADFEKYVPKLLRLEGGYANHPKDPGGPTFQGVTLAVFRGKFGQDKTIEDLKNMTRQEWTSIMKPNYWDKIQGDKIKSQSVAEIFADWCVNSGTSQIRKVQFILGVKTDGIVGQETLTAINSQDPENLFNRIKVAREKFYHDIVERNPDLQVFIKGWIIRLNSFKFEY